jgi:hypothetical protein
MVETSDTIKTVGRLLRILIEAYFCRTVRGCGVAVVSSISFTIDAA